MSAQDLDVKEPWEALPPEIGELIRPHVGSLSEAVIEAIRERVPAYRRPLRGRFGAGIRRGVEEALGQFVEIVADPGLDRGELDGVYRALGRGEYRARRSLDALLAAYRLGARVAWRRVSAIAIEAGVEPPTLALLAECVFAYIDELSALSAEGYAQAQSAAAGESDRLRSRVAALLLDPLAEEADLLAAAADAGWDPPARVAALVWTGDGRRLRARLPAGSLIVEASADRQGGGGTAFLADPEAPGLGALLERAAGSTGAVLGPPVELMAARVSAQRAADVQRLIANGLVGGEGLTRATDHLADLIAHGDERVLGELSQRTLEPIAGETAASRARLTRTLRAWLDHQGEVARVATELRVHPQTVRYRLARLRELFGDRLEDPRARFELTLALRGTVSLSPDRAPERQTDLRSKK